LLHNLLMYRCCTIWCTAAVPSGALLLYHLVYCCCTIWRTAAVPSGVLLLYHLVYCCCTIWCTAAVPSGVLLLYHLVYCCCTHSLALTTLLLLLQVLLYLCNTRRRPRGAFLICSSQCQGITNPALASAATRSSSSVDDRLMVAAPLNKPCEMTFRTLPL
jgi:hypothetical protein